MIYLSPSSKHFRKDPERFGLMLSSASQIGGQGDALENGSLWMLDNGAFTGKWIFEKWADILIKMRPFASTCVGIIVPDVPFNWEATTEQFYELSAYPAHLGFPIAYATQNGVPFDKVPWGEFQTLFIGGDHFHKRGREGEGLALEAKRRGLWVHVGRCNGGINVMPKYYPWADSADGTTLIKHPWQQFDSIKRGLDQVRWMKDRKIYQRKLI